MNARQQALKGLTLHMRSDLHLARKAWHVAAGLIGLWVHEAYNLAAVETAQALLAVGLIGLIVDFSRLRWPALNRLVLKCLKNFMRESEKRSYSGLPFYALGVSLSLYFFDERLAILAVLFLIFSDPISSLVGVAYGEEKIFPNKSLQGSLAGFIVCYLLCVAYALHHLEGPNLFNILVFSFFGGLIGMASELVSATGRVDDNLSIPILSSLGLTLINALVPLY